MKLEKTAVLIVGAGPVGLFLARRLRQLDISCILLEKRAQLSDETRSIGIHPPSLEMLEVMGTADAFVEAGCPVEKGLAYARGKSLGTINFSQAARPFNFILTLSQGITMGLLAEDADIRFENEVKHLDAQPDRVHLQCGDTQYEARWLAACDGSHSSIRQHLKIPWKGRPYRNKYFMGDFDDETQLGQHASVFIEPEGLVESFPLRNNQRRWVAQRRPGCAGTVEDLVGTIATRTGHQVQLESQSMYRVFQPERYLAASCRLGPCFLVGDAAHITSPFGGQGMNLGWMDAWELAEVFAGRMLAEAYQMSVRKRAGKGIRRAAFNMILGGRCSIPRPKELLVKTLLHSPASRLLTRQFTMRGLPLYNAPPGGG